jgi:hypothetical protein
MRAMPPEEQRPLSKAVPVLIAVLVCDTTAEDPTTKKKSLIGIFDRLWAVRFPTQRPVSVYVRLTDAEGFYQFKVKFVQTDTGVTLAEATGEANFEERLTGSDLVLAFPPLPMPAPGRYEFQVWFNDVFLGSTFLDAKPR